MKFLNSLFACLLVAVMTFSTPALASVGVYDDATKKGVAADLNFGTGLTVTGTGPKKTITASNGDTTGDLTFRSVLLAIGRVGGASSISSSSTFLSLGYYPYSVVAKRVGVSGSRDNTNGGTILPDGYPGQTIRFIITALVSGGSWVVTPTTSYGFSSLTFDTLGDTATLLFLEGVGWVIDDNGGAVVAVK